MEIITFRELRQKLEFLYDTRDWEPLMRITYLINRYTRAPQITAGRWSSHFCDFYADDIMKDFGSLDEYWESRERRAGFAKAVKAQALSGLSEVLGGNIRGKDVSRIYEILNELGHGDYTRIFK